MMGHACLCARVPVAERQSWHRLSSVSHPGTRTAAFLACVHCPPHTPEARYVLYSVCHCCLMGPAAVGRANVRRGGNESRQNLSHLRPPESAHSSFDFVGHDDGWVKKHIESSAQILLEGGRRDALPLDPSHGCKHSGSGSTNH